ILDGAAHRREFLRQPVAPAVQPIDAAEMASLPPAACFHLDSPDWFRTSPPRLLHGALGSILRQSPTRLAAAKRPCFIAVCLHPIAADRDNGVNRLYFFAGAHIIAMGMGHWGSGMTGISSAKAGAEFRWTRFELGEVPRTDPPPLRPGMPCREVHELLARE